MFGKLYEDKLKQKYPTDEILKSAKANWLEALSSLDLVEIRQGIDLLSERYPQWPPTLGDFIALCREKKPSQAAFQPFLPELPKSTWAERQAHAKIGIQAARNILKKAGKP